MFVSDRESFMHCFHLRQGKVLFPVKEAIHLNIRGGLWKAQTSQLLWSLSVVGMLRYTATRWLQRPSQ